jgi:hypothetical protein
MKIKQPVIIIGMHRSGTSMVVDLLEQSGLFMGNDQEQNNESVFFLRLNSWMLRQSGGIWFNPSPIDNLLSNKQSKKDVKNYLLFMLKTLHALSFFGIKRYLTGGAFHQSKPWGWKAPCNTFTLPIWLEVFPEAKVVWISRHGVDVANSLQVRTERKRTAHLLKFNKYKFLFNFFNKKSGFSQAINCHSLDGGLLLWEEYMERASTNCLALKNKCYHFRYEDMLETPVSTLRNLLDFCELPVESEVIARAAKRINPSRAYAYKSNQHLLEFESKNKSILSKYGY